MSDRPPDEDGSPTRRDGGPPPGTPGLYHDLKDVLRRLPEVTTVQFEPDEVVQERIRATLAPDRLEPPTGPEAPYLVVEWRRRPPHDRFWIDFADPNRDLHCGWHRDGDHPDLGPVHFQYRTAEMEVPTHESASFERDAPTEILWEAATRLLDDERPRLMGGDG